LVSSAAGLGLSPLHPAKAITGLVGALGIIPLLDMHADRVGRVCNSVIAQKMSFFAAKIKTQVPALSSVFYLSSLAWVATGPLDIATLAARLRYVLGTAYDLFGCAAAILRAATLCHAALLWQ
jgi:hypothetical protein